MGKILVGRDTKRVHEAYAPSFVRKPEEASVEPEEKPDEQEEKSEPVPADAPTQERLFPEESPEEEQASEKKKVAVARPKKKGKK